MKYTFTLDKKARKSGGDKYISDVGWVVYFPQEISRDIDDEPLDKIQISVILDSIKEDEVI